MLRIRESDYNKRPCSHEVHHVLIRGPESEHITIIHPSQRRDTIPSAHSGGLKPTHGLLFTLSSYPSSEQFSELFIWLPSGEQLTLRGPWVERRVWRALCVSVCCFQLQAVWENSPPSPKNLADKRASLTGIAAASPPQQNKQQHIRTVHPGEVGSRLSYSLCFPANLH